MEKQKLFVTGKELEEKRTQFLQARCAENQYFGMSNVGDWLLTQRQLERPTDIEAWTRIIQCNANMVGSDVGGRPLLELLGSHGFCLDEVHLSKEEFPSIDTLQRMNWLFDKTAGVLAESYITDSTLFYLSGDRTEVIRFDGNERGGTYSTNIYRSDVLISTLLTWKHSLDSEKRVQARQFIYSWLERRIQYVLDEGGKEFEEAVAVSEDGTKIVTADKVVFSRHEGPSLMCGRDLFVKNKIVLLSDFLGYRKYTCASDVPRFRRRFIKSSLEHWQQYFTAVFMPNNVFEKWLWCHIGYDDFPEGGTPFKI